MERPFHRRPGAHARRGARPHQIDRRATAEIMPTPVRRQRLLMRAPAEFGRLAALADEAVDRPGVDELARLLGERSPSAYRARRYGSPSRPALCANAAHPARVRRHRRIRHRYRAAIFSSACLTKCETRPGLAPCVSTAVGPLAPRGQRQRAFPQRVVGPLRWRQRRVGVTAGPGLDAGVEIQRAKFLAQRDQRHRRDIDRQVQQEIAAAAAAASAPRDNSRGSAAGR